MEGLTRRAEGDPPPDYGPDSTKFSVEVHHSGFFCGIGKNRTYLNETVSWFDQCDSETWAFFCIEEMIVSLGYGMKSGRLKVLWLLPGKDLSDGLRIISSDDDTVVMKQITHKLKNFVLYFDHHNHVGQNFDDIVLDPIAVLPKISSPSKVSCDVKVEVCEDDDAEIDGFDSGSDDDSDFRDSDYEVEDCDDDLFVDNVDEEVTDDAAAKGKSLYAGDCDADDGAVSTDEDLVMPDDGEGTRLKFKSFRLEDMNNPIFEVGMLFPSVEMLRAAITEYSLKQRVEIKLPRNDQRRIRAFCADGCPWNMYASWDSRAKAFMVKTYNDAHNCQKEWVLKRCTAKWLAEKYIETFRADEKLSITNFGKVVQKEWNLTPSKSKLARARRMALQKIYGDEIEQYNALWDYATELSNSNPGTTFHLNLSNGHFSTLYMSLDACKRGFLSGCRPIICLDGCHIKTKFGGQILTAIGMDPNDCIFPIAFAVVEVESLATWK
ncbi:unnamed protein product [Urochloa humidicola]